jgi:hypothetical protein
MPIQPGGGTTTPIVNLPPVLTDLIRGFIVALTSPKEIHHTFPQLSQEGYIVASIEDLKKIVEDGFVAAQGKVADEAKDIAKVVADNVATAVADTKAKDDAAQAEAVNAVKVEAATQIAALQQQIADLQAGAIPDDVMKSITDKFDALQKMIDDLAVPAPDVPPPAPEPAPEPPPAG